MHGGVSPSHAAMGGEAPDSPRYQAPDSPRYQPPSSPQSVSVSSRISASSSNKTKLKLALAEEEHRRWSGRLSSISSDIDSDRHRLSESKKALEETRELLRQTFGTAIHERSYGATLVFDFELAQKKRRALKEEVDSCEAVAEVELQATAAVRERLRWMRQMEEALKTARVEAEISSGTASTRSSAVTATLGLAREANEQERGYCGELLPGLDKTVAEATALEMEHGVLVADAQQFKEKCLVAEAERENLLQKQGAARSEMQRAEAANGELARCVAAARAKLAAAEEEYQKLQEEHARIVSVIKSQQVGMHELRSLCQGQVAALSPIVAETKQRKRQAELLHSRRLEEIETAGQRGLLVHLPKTPPPQSARSRPESSLQGARSRPESSLQGPMADRPSSRTARAKADSAGAEGREVGATSRGGGSSSNRPSTDSTSLRDSTLPPRPSSRPASRQADCATASSTACGAGAALPPYGGVASPTWRAAGTPQGQPPASAREPADVAPAGGRTAPLTNTSRPSLRGGAPAPPAEAEGGGVPDMRSDHAAAAQAFKGGLSAATPGAAATHGSPGGIHATPRGLGQAGQLVVGRA